MKFFYRLYRFLYKSGYVVLTLSILLLFSMGIVSYKLKGEKSINPYCLLDKNQSLLPIQHEKIVSYSYSFSCNTLELEIEVMDDVKKDEIITVLLDLKKMFEEQSIFYPTHVIVSSNQLQQYIFATLNLGNEGILFIGE